MIASLDIHAMLRSLSAERPLFHSEADFQHALAWKIRELLPAVFLRLELPVESASGTIHLDVLVSDGDSSVALELKYKTRRFDTEFRGERFLLMGHGAQDTGRYDFFKDVHRLEHFSRSRPNSSGIAVFLTNDSSYWKPLRSGEVGYAQFNTAEGRIAGGQMRWGQRAGAGTTKGRDNPVDLTGSYDLQWKDYSTVDAKGYSAFRYLALHVGAKSAAAV